MQQLVIEGQGRISLKELPDPACNQVGVVVRSAYSLISSGTETSTLTIVRRSPLQKILYEGGLLGKALHRLRRGELLSEVWKALFPPPNPPNPFPGSPLSLGYSGAGIVVEVGTEVRGIEPGQRVAYVDAPHAGLVQASRNLVIPLPKEVSLEEGSFVALGAIALQGVRRLRPQLGDTVAVIGMGLIGQITAQLLKVAGCRVIGVDILDLRLALGRKLGVDTSVNAGQTDPVKFVREYTEGSGADGVVICAYSKSPEPIEQALEMAGRKSRVTLVGAVKIELPRPPLFKKELDFLISTGRGPGLFDPRYEEEGLNYPAEEVRWTETRNMEEFLWLVAEGKVEVKPLISHLFPIEKAARAYERLVNRSEETLGICLEYPHAAPPEVKPSPLTSASPAKTSPQIGVGFIGCGSFSRMVLLPLMRDLGYYRFQAVATRTRESGIRAKDDFGFVQATLDYRRILEDPLVDLVVIATRHDLHAQLAIEALERGKNVYVEKPLGMTVAECQGVVDRLEGSAQWLTVGFNRRFSPLVSRIKNVLSRVENPIMINYRVVRGFLPASFWVYDPKQGGGRILGEAVHFFDLMRWLVGVEPTSVFASGGTLSHIGTQVHDNFMVNVQFANGSLASLFYGDLGSPDLPVERMELFAGNLTILLDGFQELTVKGWQTQPHLRLPEPQAGYKEELRHIAEAIGEDKRPSVTARDGLWATKMSVAAIEALQTGKPQPLQK